MTLPARMDHLVVLAADLAQGERWCRDTFGIEPGPGGEHALMGTHNRLFRIATVDHPRAYFEIIAVDPKAQPQQGRRRWFDMDEPRVREAVASSPRLAHFVVNVPDIAQALAAWRALGIDRGPALRASRMTPRGPLEWQISVREDGARLFDGCLPTLIQWGDAHPAAAMEGSGVTLHSLAITHPQAQLLASAFEAIGLPAVRVREGEPNLCATLIAPTGTVRLESNGL